MEYSRNNEINREKSFANKLDNQLKALNELLEANGLELCGNIGIQKVEPLDRMMSKEEIKEINAMIENDLHKHTER